MSLSEILAGTDLKVVTDGKRLLRQESARELIAIKQVKADSPSDFLARSLALDEPVLAAVTDSGTLYILSPGTHGLVTVQGSTANKAQKATLEKLAMAYTAATGLMLPDLFVPKLDPKKVVKEPTVPEETFGEEAAPSDVASELSPE